MNHLLSAHEMPPINDEEIKIISEIMVAMVQS